MHEHVKHLYENRKVLKSALLAVFSFMFVEFLIGWFFNSLALLADAAHMFADSAALIIAFFAAWIAGKRAPPEKTFGYLRAETLAGLANCTILATVAYEIIHNAIIKLMQPAVSIISLPIILAAAIGLIINLVVVRKLHGSEEIYMKAAFYEVIFDTAGSVIVLCSAVIMQFTKIYYFDALAALILGILVVPRLVGLFKSLINTILEVVPDHINFTNLINDMLKVRNVKEVHDVHVWEVATGFTTLSAHVVAQKESSLHEIEEMLHKKYHIWHATLQFEPKPAKEVYVHGRWIKKA
ncbi:MAG: cation diffusion facilitator family transporter [Candidatus Nanoarchaeia archaeon]